MCLAVVLNNSLSSSIREDGADRFAAVCVI